MPAIDASIHMDPRIKSGGDVKNYGASLVRLLSR